MRQFGKTARLLTLALLLAVTLCGCVRIKVDVNVRRNGRADISMLYAVHDSLLSVMDSEDGFSLSPEDVERYRANGWEVRDYSSGNYRGYVLSIENADLSSTELADSSSSSVQKKDSLYILDVDLFSEEDRESINEYASMIKTADGSCTVSLTLPVKPVKHNATSVTNDGKTLEWDLLEMNTAEPIHVEFKAPNLALIAAAALAAVAAAAAVGFALFRRRAATPAEEPEPVWEPEPAAADPGGPWEDVGRTEK